MPSQSQHGMPSVTEGYVPYENQGARQSSLYNRPWHIAKVAIRGCNIASSAIIIGITVHSLIYLYWSPYLLWFSAIPAAFAVCWDVSELITVCARGGRIGIHPGAHVGLHLLFWLIFATAIVCESLNLYFIGYYGDGFIATQQHVALAFTCLLLINHFTLFVRACIETHQRNTRPPIYMVPVNMPAPMQPAGSYAPSPFPPQQEKGQMTGANAPTDTTTQPAADGTYYGPGSRV
ncbi:uncharacterized protein ColSpa_10729 [Colletotrichum spaethianum]|uniref:Uncharacterized protein n=1 Tax=Colletotrichum spaethianum TaxID=700344 RepID=A0AA37PE59_9PEZI|nr:uncharacterized protein ColSpa_10729 [Colletotrichum spaethianum]GKT50548.1 hypothetical protein ColSpa_10729 [Colletotrichum spaethianum]